MSENEQEDINIENENTDSDELFERYRFVVDTKQSSVRIDKYLMEKMEKVSRNKVQSLIKHGVVKVNEGLVKPNYKVRPNEIITVVMTIPPNENSIILPEEIPLDIRYEDEDVIVLYKPAGLVVHPGVGNMSGTLVNGLANYLNPEDMPVKDGNGQDRIGLVHRIDKDTTGLMVIAKTELAMTHLSKQFFDHTVIRKYNALVWGNFDEPSGTITGNLARNPSNRFQMFVFEDGETGKHAVTHYKVLEDYYYVSLVECQLETGRTHQIRAHMKYIGHTLFNDAKYGGDKILKGTVFTKYRRFVENTFDVLPRQALHAKILGFVHPRTGKDMYFETPLPDDFQECLDKWKAYLGSRKDKK